MEEKERKNESGSVLAGQAGMEDAGWQEIMKPIWKDVQRKFTAG